MKHDFIKVTRAREEGLQTIISTADIYAVCITTINMGSGFRAGDTIITLREVTEGGDRIKIAVEESIDLIFRMLHLGEWKNNE